MRPPFVLLLALATGAAAQTAPPARFARPVFVVDSATQEAIAGAEVVDLITRNSVRTDSVHGSIVLVPEFVKVTGAVLRITKVGYAPIQTGVIDPTEPGALAVMMHRAGLELPAVLTTAKYNLQTDDGHWAGFANRCTLSVVTCVVDSTLSAHPAAPLSYFIKRTPGILGDCGRVLNRRDSRVRSGGGGSARVPDCVSMRGIGLAANTACQPTYYVDGFLRGSGGTVLDDVEQYLVSTDTKGIEVYLSGEPTPPRFLPAPGSEGCGVIAIWTK